MRNTDIRVDHRGALAQPNLPAVMLHCERDRDFKQSMRERLANINVFSMVPIAVHILSPLFLAQRCHECSVSALSGAGSAPRDVGEGVWHEEIAGQEVEKCLSP